MAMDDLLKALLAGATGGTGQPQQPAQGQPAPGGALPDLLGTLLGGLAGGTGQQAAPAAPAQAQQPAGGLGGLLGSLLGGGGTSPLGSIVQTLAQKLGLPPAVAQAVVLFVLSKLLPALIGGATPQAQAAPQPAKPAPTQPQAGGLDLGDLLGRMLSGSPRRLSANYLQSTGLHAELAQQAGLDEETALKSLQEVLLGLGSTLAAATAQSAPEPQPTPEAKSRPKPAAAKAKPQPAAKKTPAKKRQPPEE
ncbi:MAG: hypothetical protein Kow00123_24720 [Anaerolineales bacterium]